MNYLKLLLKNTSICIGILFILNLFITLFSYFNIISNTSIIKIITLFISLLIGGYLTGINSKEKGWLEGLKFSLIIILIFLVINLLFIKSFNFSNFIYYIIIMISSILGSMIGISKRKLD